jgi:hypothetical protein
LRIFGIIELQVERLQRKRIETEVIEDRWLYEPPESLTAEQREKVAMVYKVNELLLADIRKRVAARLGPDRFVILLAPTKFEYGLDPRLSPDANHNAVADALLETLARQQIPAIDGRKAITAADFWKGDGHWRPSGHEKIGKLLAGYLEAVMAGQTPTTYP